MDRAAYGTSHKRVALVAAGTIGLGARLIVFGRRGVSGYVADACVWATRSASEWI